MFAYLRTKEQFLKDCNAIDKCAGGMERFIEHAIKYRTRSDPEFGVGEGEVESWKETFDQLKRYLSGAKADFKIALEFIHQFRTDKSYEGDSGFAKRTDVMIAVKEKTGNRNVLNKKIYIIEVKRWKTLGKNAPPADQVCDYCDLLLANNDQVTMQPDPTGEKIQLVPVVWMFKMARPTDGDEALEHLKNCKYGSNLQLRFKDESIADLLDNVPEAYDNDVFKQFRKGFPAFLLHEEVKGIWNSTHLFNDRCEWDDEDIINKDDPAGSKIKLRGDQNVCFRNLTERIEINDEKKPFFIVGGVGSGKSLVAILLFKYFRDKGVDTKFYIPEIAPVRAYNGYLWEILFEQAEFNTDYSAGDVVIIDEAHNLYENVYSKIINSRQGKVTIFLSDGDQVVERSQKGEIRSDDDDDNYYLNSQFRCNKDDGYITFINDILNDEKEFPFKADCLDFDVQVIEKLNNGKLPEELVSQCSLLIRSDSKESEQYKVGNQGFSMFTLGSDVMLNIKLNLGEFDPADLFIGSNTDEQYGTLYDVRGLDIKKAIVVIRSKDMIYDKDKGKVRLCGRAHNSNRIKANTYRILLTRATETCYIYCEDEALRDFLIKEKGITVYKGE